MSFATKFVIAILSATLSLYILVGGAAGVFTRAQQPINDSGAQVRIFESVLQHIQNDYVDEPNLEKVRAGALRGLANGLDPYSSYLTPDQVKDFQAKKSAGAVGIGAELSQVGGYVFVIGSVKNSPAEKSGIKAGDYIEYIENKATRDISLYDAQQLLLGENGSKVKLRVLRSGAKPQTVEVTRGSFKIPEAEIKLDANKVGILKVYSLQEGESADIKNRLNELVKQGATKIVLDLRGVAAGSLTEAVAVANYFIKDGTLAQKIGREGKSTQTFTADAAKHLFAGQVVTLMDLGTSGAAEVITSAMIERGRGDVVGERSFGAGAEQQLFTLRDGDGLLLTTTKWASSNGVAFLADDRQKSGVKPTVEVKHPNNPEPIDPDDLENSEEPSPTEPQAAPTPKPVEAKEDVQLKKALEILNQTAQK